MMGLLIQVYHHHYYYHYLYNHYYHIDPSYDLSVLRISPSTLFSGIWQEGTFYNRDYSYNLTDFNASVPYKDAYIRLTPLTTISAYSSVDVSIAIENGLMAYCGFTGSFPNLLTALPYIPVTNTFKIYIDDDATTDFDQFGWVGKGCSQDNKCNGHGVCDWCYDKCICQEGFGSPSDNIMLGKNIRKDCSERVCPSGKAIADIPSSATQAHAQAECSNRGICNRDSGECKCFYPFAGYACERMSCPNNCAGISTMPCLLLLLSFIIFIRSWCLC